MRVLAIDGGGVRGIVPAAMLACWEEDCGPIPDAFDLFAGTSTGAILAASLAVGLSAQRVREIFETSAPAVFSRDGKKFIDSVLSFKGWAKPAYSSEALRSALQEALGDITLGDCPRPLTIPALDVVTGTPRVFRSGHHPEGKGDRQIPVLDAVLASTAAPVLFPSAKVAGSSYIDGGMWANNPALIAFLDAKELAKRPVKLVSLGCGRPFWGKAVGFGERRGLVGWGLPLVALLMSAQSEGVHSHLVRLLSEADYRRIDPQLPADLSGLDQPANMPSLVARASEVARRESRAVAEMLQTGVEA